MSLSQISQIDPTALSKLGIDQVLALAGDGRLLDGSECSRQFRQFISQAELPAIERYISQILSSRRERNGLILQDLVNELGRRVGFDVLFGRYQGVQGQTGNDGLWTTATQAIVVEVKTTDAFRINLDVIAGYAASYREEKGYREQEHAILIVVGRQDTGDLEAQIRGSRYAWDVRVISTDALISLAKLYSRAVDTETQQALQRALMPTEYTRLDHVIQLMSNLAFDVERGVLLEASSREENDTTPNERPPQVSRKVQSVEEMRETIVKKLESANRGKLTKISQSVYQTTNGETVIVAISKRYDRTDQHYWYALQNHWLGRLQRDESFLLLAMLDKDYVFQIPSRIVKLWPEQLNRTLRGSTEYWHLGLVEDGDSVYLTLPLLPGRTDLSPFRETL